MLIYGSRLIGAPILSVQAGGAIAEIIDLIVEPDTLKIIGFKVDGPLVAKSDANILDVSSVREYSKFGLVIDSIEEFVEPEDVVKISKVLALNFGLTGLKAETRKGTKLGKVIDFTVTTDDFNIQQIVIKRPTMKSLIDPELTIGRQEIVEITDYKVIVRDEKKTAKTKSTKEEFVPNFVNPFRKNEQGFAPADSQNPDEPNIE